MADANWYYSHGDEQLGPVTAAQLKKLVGGGKLSPTDLVWKEGMDDWVAASTIDGLIPIAPPSADSPREGAPSGPPPAVAPVISTEPRAAISAPLGRGKDSAAGGGSGFTELLGYARFIAYPALALGLLLALVSRGCDQLSSLDIRAAKAKHELANEKFNSKWNRDKQRLEDERTAARDNGLTERVSQINIDLDKHDEKRDEAERELKRGEWQDLQEAADTAQFDHTIGAWRRELCFRFGTIMFTFGLLGVGLISKGADRWVCLVILAIIIMNLYNTQMIVGLGER